MHIRDPPVALALLDALVNEGLGQRVTLGRGMQGIRRFYFL